MLFSTQRTRCDLLSSDDASALCRYHLDNASYLAPWEPQRDTQFFTLAACQERAELFAAEQRQGVALRLAARLLPSDGSASADADEIVALCMFTNIVRGPFQACHLGYSISERHAGRGLMTEVLDAALKYVFAELDLHRVMANYMPENTASARVLEKLGFAKEGLAKSYLMIAGQWRDHVLTAKVNPQHLGEA